MAALESDEHRRHDRRLALRRLDCYLTLLENANVRGQSRVGATLAERLHDVDAHITAQTPVREAIAATLRAQERVLRPQPARLQAAAAHESGILDEASARQLTERIRTGVGQVCLMLLEAHEGHAWTALGYRTWHDYVQSEFAISRSRSYELLDRARVTRAIEQASGVSALADISTLTVRQLRRRLPELLGRIQARITGDTCGDRRTVVLDAIREEKQQALRRRSHVPDVAATTATTLDAGHLRDAIAYLARLEDARVPADRVPAGLRAEFDQVQAALRWLSGFRDACVRRSATDVS